MPDCDDVIHRHAVVRVNDGNDSNVQRDLVVSSTQCYPLKFYNTAIPKYLGNFDAPVVLTVNPGVNTDELFHAVPDPVPVNLMFIRVRVNSWNIDRLVEKAVDYYTSRQVPVILTFMAYFDTAEKAIPQPFREDYIFRRRTINSYWAITTDAWRKIMGRFADNKLVSSCGKIEGEDGDTKCKFCGNCLREFFSTMERMRTR